jgi:bifunctional DNA-binding transcriptional regulator/antitoxin component of YhaV-PrlF toxin-antitoxin module
VTREDLGLAAGDTVEIVYSGEIAESYPMQIHHVYAIKRVETTRS